jgi:hypothetical protein
MNQRCAGVAIDFCRAAAALLTLAATVLLPRAAGMSMVQFKQLSRRHKGRTGYRLSR